MSHHRFLLIFFLKSEILLFFNFGVQVFWKQNFPLGIHTVRDSIMQQIGPIFFTLILSDFWAIRNQHKDLITENHHLSTTDTTILMENCQILPWNEENLDWQIDCCFRVHTVFQIYIFVLHTFLLKNSKLFSQNLPMIKNYLLQLSKNNVKNFSRR